MIQLINYTITWIRVISQSRLCDLGPPEDDKAPRAFGGTVTLWARTGSIELSNSPVS